MTLDGYVALTADIPFGWLDHAVRRLMLQPATIFAPQVGKIREQAAIEIIRTKRVVAGENPDRSQTGLTHVPADRIDHWIARARQIEGLPKITPASSAVYIPPQLEATVVALLAADGVKLEVDEEGDAGMEVAPEHGKVR